MREASAAASEPLRRRHVLRAGHGTIANSMMHALADGLKHIRSHAAIGAARESMARNIRRHKQANVARRISALARRRRIAPLRPDAESAGCITAPVPLLRKQKMRASRLCARFYPFAARDRGPVPSVRRECVKGAVLSVLALLSRCRAREHVVPYLRA
jgi:hypothetical protein